MKISSSKENILKKVRQALSNSVPVPFPRSEGNNSVFQPATEDLEVQFAHEFTRLLGKFAYCIDKKDLQMQLAELAKQRQWASIYCRESQFNEVLKGDFFSKIKSSDLEKCDAAITGCELLIA